MTSFQLKILAIICMLIDHIGYVFFPHVYILRLIGRIAFPIFAWMIAMGYGYTSNVKKYFIRLAMFSIISELFFDFAFMGHISFTHQNVFFTLFFGLAAIYFFDRQKDKRVGMFIVFLIALLAEFLNTDYGLYGVVMIFLFYYFKDNKRMMIVSQLVYNLIYILPYILSENTSKWSFIQFFCVLSLIFISLYNNKQGKKIKYVFYLFYPLHLFILGLIKYLL